MVFIIADTWQKNDVEVIIVDEIKWLNEKHIEEQLERVNFRHTSRQYPSKLRRERQELQESLKQPCRKFLRGDLAVQLIMDYRRIPAVSFKHILRFNQQDPIMTQEQSVLTKIKTAF